MKYPIRAKYGERDKTHALLECSADPSLMPPLLLELTDKPPGYIPPGERWWPSVGCGPIERWWALWWTIPDDSATRGGMGKSEVAMWPLESAPSISDLTKELETLNGGERIPEVPRHILVASVEALLAGKPNPPVFGNLIFWPALIAAFWARLWPRARTTFSARVAISPPQGSESVSPPWLYAVSEDRVNQWPPASIIPLSAVDSSQISRGARWLTGDADDIMDELFLVAPHINSDFSGIRRISRAADRLEAARTAGDAPRAIELLRTLCAIAPASDALVALKSEALAILHTALPAAPVSAITSLANIRLSELPTNSDVPSSIEIWVQTHLPGTPLADAKQFLMLVTSGSAESWWIHATRSGIGKGVNTASTAWTTFLLQWLAALPEPKFAEIFGAPSASTEENILVVACGAKFNSTELSTLLENSRALLWFRLYAFASFSLNAPKAALESQLALERNNTAGLAFLVGRIEEKVLIESAVAINNPRLTSLVSQRTAKSPGLLVKMDLARQPWRALWASHIASGGIPWPPNVDREKQTEAFLLAATGANLSGVIARFAADFAPVALRLEDRTALWSRLDKYDAETLAAEAARLILEAANSGSVFASPEPYLLKAILRIVSTVELSAAGAICLVTWQPGISEYEAQRIVDRVRIWNVGSDRLGELIMEHRWTTVARGLHNRYRRGDDAVLPAVQACAGLLFFWEVWNIPFGPTSTLPQIDQNQLIARVAQLGSDLASARLDHLWQRAGGKEGALRTTGSGQDRWHDAAIKAAGGALRDGMMSLIQVLLEDFPHNADLEGLKQILKAYR